MMKSVFRNKIRHRIKEQYILKVSFVSQLGIVERSNLHLPFHSLDIKLTICR